jgi:BASS family bile acid:Na+ symporter
MGLALVACLIGLAMDRQALWQPAAAVAAFGLAIGLGAFPTSKTFQFTAWIAAVVVGAMIYPQLFLHWGPIDLKNKWLLLVLIQLVMFGMGTQMSLRDFAGVAKMPYGVFVGIVCQFTIMPLVGYGLAKGFGFDPEVAAGIVLIGSCSSGLASNVMCYLARANLALSVTLTSVATLMAPIMTPLWMKLLASEFVAVDFLKMMMDIVKIVLVPIGAAMLHDYLKHAGPRGWRVVRGLAVIAAGWLTFLALGGWDAVTARFAGSAGEKGILTGFAAWGYLLSAVPVGLVYHGLTRRLASLDAKMPVFSMFGIIYFTAVITAGGRDDLMRIGGLLFLAAAIHNTLGYVLGFWLSRLVGLSRADARTVALEVGLQNGAMATQVASGMGKLTTMGLASAIFSPWMNVSGSVLANYWRRKPVD